MNTKLSRNLKAESYLGVTLPTRWQRTLMGYRKVPATYTLKKFKIKKNGHRFNLATLSLKAEILKNFCGVSTQP